MNKYTLELTKEELDFIYERCLRKAVELEESHLEDLPRFRLSWDIMLKIMNLKSQEN